MDFIGPHGDGNVSVRDLTRCVVLSWICLLPTLLTAAELNHSLFRAIRSGDLELVDSLLRQGTPANLQTADGTTALMIAARDGSAECLHWLLQYGADPKAVNDRGITALLWAAGDEQKVRHLLQHKPNINARSAIGRTPLFVAAGHPGNSATVRELLAAGAELTARKTGSTALTVAVLAGDPQTVELLLEAGMEQERIGNHFGASLSLLELAARQGHADVCEVLLKHAEQHSRFDKRDAGDALNRALLAQKPEIARRLIRYGASLSRLTSDGKVPPIVLAAYNEQGDTSVAKMMLQRDVDPSAENQYGESALTWAHRRGHKELIDLLGQAGASATDEEQPTIPDRSINLHAGNQQQLLTQAIAKSLRLLQHSSDVFLKERRSCVSCHHQNLPAVAVGWARDRGIQVDQASAQKMIDRQTRAWERFRERAYQMDRPVPVVPRFLGYGLWSFSALGYPADEITEASVWYLAAMQHPDGHWTSGMMRPPLGGADLVATTLAMRSLQLYPLPGRAKEFEQRVERAARWIRNTPARYHQEQVFQILGLAWAGERTHDLSQLTMALLEQQRDDGGWAQLPGLKSDAWATSQSLVALRIAGTLSASDSAYQRGLEFLLSTQFDDGSWFVKGRAFPFQPPFDSEFPFGRDQWVSAPATAWAVMAMTLALEPRTNVVGWQKSAPDKTSTGNVEPVSVASTPKSAAGGGQIGKIDFVDDIKPLLERSCVGCHSGSEAQAGYRMTDRQSLLRGGESGLPAIVAGDISSSQLFAFISGGVDELEMPPLDSREKFPALTQEQQAKVRAWIGQGATWPDGIRLKAAAY